MMKKIAFILVSLLLVFSLSISASAEEKGELLVDGAELLTRSEAVEISERLTEINETYGFDLVIVTVETVGTKDPEIFAENFYENGNYGVGEDRSGAILLISEKTRDWFIIATGVGEEIFPDVYDLADSFLPYFADDDWYGGLDAFVTDAEISIDTHFNFQFGTNLVISLVVGFVIALIVVSVMKGKLKSVRFQTNAREYVREGSFVLNHSRDLFLYSTVTRVAKPKNTSNGSRVGGGGGSRGGGKF